MLSTDELEGLRVSEAIRRGVLAERDELRALVERIEKKMTAHRETYVAAIAGSEKMIHELRAEVEQKKRDVDYLLEMQRSQLHRADLLIEQARTAEAEAERLRASQKEATRLLAQVMRGYANQPLLYADLNHVRQALVSDKEC